MEDKKSSKENKSNYGKQGQHSKIWMWMDSTFQGMNVDGLHQLLRIYFLCVSWLFVFEVVAGNSFLKQSQTKFLKPCFWMSPCVFKISPVFVSQVGSSLRLAWECAVRLEAQLGEADRPWEQRNRWLQDIEMVGSDLDLVMMSFPAKFNGRERDIYI